ncbi:hypothetical protein [Nocardia africana]|uniref:Uncharacterized protein n=1 Tax=Nocardia africana TaxID=134964 RepID=A0A378WWX6_9NOCA|nr:hypothetical protein [Nocardia africana]SUA44961.1 Uncharacterised protein [Nocardia africana]
MTDIARLAREVAELHPQPRQSYWRSLSFCVVDAVFSIGARYSTVVAVVGRVANEFGITTVTAPDIAGTDPDPLALPQLLDRFPTAEGLSVVARNRQRTSTRNGILKADASLQYAKILVGHDITTLVQARELLADPERLQAVDAELAGVPGEGNAGVRRGYLWMLVGADDLIKPDRMVLRWLRRHGADVDPASARIVLADIAEHLTRAQGHRVTPWEIDHAIWTAARPRRRAR